MATTVEWRREDKLVIEGELCLEFALQEDEEDRITVGGYDLHDLLASQLSTEGNRVQKLGRFRVVFERVG